MQDSMKEPVSQALAQIPSGCFVLTAGQGAGSTGILASWVQQAGFEPPAVTVAVKNGRPIQAVIEQTGHFVLNLIEDSQKQAMFRHFGRGFETDEPAFGSLKTRQEPTGVVLEDCLAHLGCKVAAKIGAGDHVVYVGVIVGGATHRQGKPYVHLRTNGFNY